VKKGFSCSTSAALAAINKEDIHVRPMWKTWSRPLHERGRRRSEEGRRAESNVEEAVERANNESGGGGEDQMETERGRAERRCHAGRSRQETKSLAESRMETDKN